jgi:predicted PurR-regulated permease PerM
MDQTSTPSPRWSSTTKLLIGLIIVAIAAFLLYRFLNLLTPLLIVIITAYLLHPVAAVITRGLRISWKASVNILYLLILLILLGLLTLGGVGLVGQVQSLIRSVQDIIANLPAYVADLSTRVFQLGPFELDMKTLNLDLKTVSQQLLSFVQPLLSQTGTLVGAAASGAAEVFGWTFFVLIVSYFILIESSGLRKNLINVELPGYHADIDRLGKELSKIWNAFLRGQIIIFALAVGIYSILLPILGVRYALGIALMAGLAKFLPYVGPAITWIVMALVTLIQENPFGLQHWIYAAIVVGVTLVIDQIIDSFITPRIMARTLKVHPAAVLVTALIFASLLGILGVVIAAPLLATFMLLGRYVTRKMFDLDPWPEKETALPPVGSDWIRRGRKLLRSLFGNKAPLRKKEETIPAFKPAPDLPVRDLEIGVDTPRSAGKTPSKKAGSKRPRGIRKNPQS